jgi:hypothetical protein
VQNYAFKTGFRGKGQNIKNPAGAGFDTIFWRKSALFPAIPITKKAQQILLFLEIDILLFDPGFRLPVNIYIFHDSILIQLFQFLDLTIFIIYVIGNMFRKIIPLHSPEQGIGGNESSLDMFQ